MRTCPKCKLMAIITTVLILIPNAALAYSRVPWDVFGWRTYRLTNQRDVLNKTRMLGGLDNSQGRASATYSFSQVVNESWSKGGSLSSKITGGNSGLGAEISSTITWNFTQSISSTQTYGPVDVGPRHKVILYGDFYGNRSTGLAKYYLAGVTVNMGSYEVRSIHALVFRPVWTYPGGVTPRGLPTN